MTDEQEKFIKTLISAACDHEAWLQIVRFGMQTLLKDQDVLFRVIMDEVEHRLVGDDPEKFRVCAAFQQIFDELGLSFKLAK